MLFSAVTSTTQEAVQPTSAPVTSRQSAATPVKVATSSEVLNAEILWTLKVMAAHYSCKSSEESNLLFQRMFPDSSIAARFQCGERKSAYLSVFGLAPHFKDILQSNVKGVDHYVLLFDESMNKKNGKKQMDFHVRFWKEDSVVTRYLTSEFMGHCTAEDMGRAFNKVVADLGKRKLLQLSMDGPHVNWKLFNNISQELKQELHQSLLNVGSCGLHVVHGAFKRGAEKSGLSIDKLLSSLYYLFNNSPARREDYVTIAETELFPLKFCKTRWIENAPAAARAMKLWPQICDYVKAVEKKKIPTPDNNSFSTVQAATRDPLIVTKLAFFESVAIQVTPFLTKYQTDQPMLPFLVSDLKTIIKTVLERYVKPAALSDLSTKQLASFNPRKEEHYKELSKIDLGMKADRALRDVKKSDKCSDKDIVIMKKQCRDFLIEMSDKLLEKTPIVYPLARCMSCLDPRVIYASASKSKTNFYRIIGELADAERITCEEGDEVKRQYGVFIDGLGSYCDYNPDTQRVDLFWYEALSKNPECNKLWLVVKQLLILSHGQATVERGFSVNRQIETENMSDQTTVARRIICDHVAAVGGILNVTINKQLLLSASSARQRYFQHLDDQKKEKAEREQRGVKRKLVDEVESVKKRVKQIKIDIDELFNSADKMALKAETVGNLTMLTKSNSLRRTAKEKSGLLKSIEEELQSKMTELKNA